MVVLIAVPLLPKTAPRPASGARITVVLGSFAGACVGPSAKLVEGDGSAPGAEASAIQV